MFEQMVSSVMVEEEKRSIRDAQRYGPVGDEIQQARRRPIRGFAQRFAARITRYRGTPARRPQVGVGATQPGG